MTPRLPPGGRAPLGRALLAAESELLGEALEDVFGWEFLQIGAWGSSRELLSCCRTRRQTIVAAHGFPAGADIIARPSQLPVTSDSIDAALLPHTLEFAADPYAIIREVDRVLVAEGQLLVLGFRPWSLWGMRARWSRSGFPPGMRRVLSERRVREWLVLLGYEIVADTSYLYCSPWSKGCREARPDPPGPIRCQGTQAGLDADRPRLPCEACVIGCSKRPRVNDREIYDGLR